MQKSVFFFLKGTKSRYVAQAGMQWLFTGMSIAQGSVELLA